jgi:hypothetical protein
MTTTNPIDPNLILQGLTPSDLSQAQIQARVDLAESIFQLIVTNASVPIFEAMGLLEQVKDELLHRTRQLAAAYEQQQFAAWQAAQTPVTTPAPSATPTPAPPPSTN